MNLEANIMLSTGISSSRVHFRCVRFMGCTSEKLWFWATICHHVGAPKLPHPRLPLASLIGKGIDWCPGPANNGKVDARGLFDFDFEMWLNNTVFAVLFVIFRGNFLGVSFIHLNGLDRSPFASHPHLTRTLNYLQSACGYWRHHVLLNHPNCLRNHRRCGPPGPATNLKPPSHWINGSTWKLEKFVQLTNRVKCELAIKKRFSSRPRSKSPATKQNAYLARPESRIDHILWYKYNTVCSKFTFTELPKFCGVTIQFACSKAFRLKASNLDITSQKALWQVLTRVDKVDVAHALHCICTINPCALSIPAWRLCCCGWRGCSKSPRSCLSFSPINDPMGVEPWSSDSLERDSPETSISSSAIAWSMGYSGRFVLIKRTSQKKRRKQTSTCTQKKWKTFCSFSNFILPL